MTLIKCIQSFGNISLNINNNSNNIVGDGNVNRNDVCGDSSNKEDKNKISYIITGDQLPHDCNSCGSGFTPNHNFHMM